MATVKIKFRPSSVSEREGRIFYQVIHNRIACQQKTSYRLYEPEWNPQLSQVAVPKTTHSRYVYLSEIKHKIQMDINRLQRIIFRLENNGVGFTAKDVLVEFASNQTEDSLFNFMQGIIHQLKAIGKLRTSETYESTLNSFSSSFVTTKIWLWKT